MQVWRLARLLGQLTAMFSNVDDLFAHGDLGSSEIAGVTGAGWDLFFGLFPAVETLRLSGKMALCISSALDDMFDDDIILPVLRSIRFIKDEDDSEGESEDVWNNLVVSMDRFLSFHHRSGCPVTVIRDIAGDEVR
jgi:hypothetical protein